MEQIQPTSEVPSVDVRGIIRIKRIFTSLIRQVSMSQSENALRMSYLPLLGDYQLPLDCSQLTYARCDMGANLARGML